MSAIDRINKKRKELELQEQVKAGKTTSSQASMQRIESLTNELRQNNNKLDYADLSEVIPTRSSIKSKGSMTTDSNSNVTITGTVGNGSNEEKPWYKQFFKSSDAFKGVGKDFDDGYDFGDVTKTLLKGSVATAKTVGATTADIGLNAVEGVARVGEGVGKLIAGGTAQVADWAGKDEWAQKVRNRIAGKEKTGLGTEGAPVSYWLNKAQEKIDKNSVLGKSGDEIASLVGYTGGLVYGGQALGAIGGTATAGTATTGISANLGNVGITVAGKTLNVPTLAFVGGASSGLEEAYGKDNVTDVQAWTKALGSGAIEGVTEGLFGMFGVGGSSLDDFVSDTAIKGLKTGIGKALASTGIKASGEAVEEFLSYAGNQGLDFLIDKASKESSPDFYSNWNWEEVGEQMGMAFISSGIAQGGSTVVNANAQANIAIKNAEQELGRKLTSKEKISVRDQVLNSMVSEDIAPTRNEINNTVTQEEQTNSLVDVPSNTLNTVNNDKITKSIEELQEDLKTAKGSQEKSAIAIQIDALREGFTSVNEYNNFLEQERQDSLIAPVKQTTDNTQINSQVVDNTQINNNKNIEEQKKYYHGTRGNFEKFDNSKIGQNYEGEWSSLGKGFYFTVNYNEAKEYGKSSINDGEVSVKEATLNINNPFYAENLSENNQETIDKIINDYNLEGNITTGYELVKALKNNGYDSTEVLKQNGYDGIIADDEVVVFDSNQIDLKKENIEEAKNPQIKNEDFAKQVDSYVNKTMASNEMFDLGKTPDVIKDLGIPNLEITMKQKTLKHIIENGELDSHQHGIDPEIIKKIPEAIANPLNVLYSNNSSKGDSIVVVTDLSDNADRQIIASILIDSEGRIGNIDFLSNELTSAYGKNNYDEYMKKEIAKGNLLYDIDEGKIKELAHARVKSSESPSPINNIVQNSENVNLPTKEELANLEDIRQNKSGSEYASAFFDLRDKYGQANLYKGINENNANSKTLEERVKGDELLDAQDFIEEVKSVGAKVDDKGYVTVYHVTTPESAEKIKSSGKMFGKENGLFFSTSKNAQQAAGRGGETLEFKIPAEKLLLDDIFSDNADVKIPLSKANEEIDISKYLVKEKQNNTEIAPVRSETTQNVQEDLAPIKEAVEELKAVKKDVSDKINELRKGMEEIKTNIQEEISPIKEALEEIDIPGLENLAKQNLDSLKEEDIPFRNNLTEEERDRLEELETMDNAFGISSSEELELAQLKAKEEGKNYMPDSEYSPLSSEYEMPETITPKTAQEKIKSYLGANEKEAADLYNKIATDENFDKDALDTYIRNHFKEDNYEYYESQEVKDARRYIRSTKLDMTNIKSEFPSSKDYNNFRKSHFGSLKLANSGQSVDSFYLELQEEYPQYFSNDAVTPLDQLNAIADFMDNNQAIQKIEGEPIPEEVIADYTDSIYNDVINAEATKSLDEELNNYVDKLTTEEIIAPYKGQELTSPETVEETKPKTRKQMERRLATVDNQITRLTDLANRMNESMNKYNKRIAEAQEQIEIDRIRNGNTAPLDEYLNEQIIQSIYEQAAPVTEKYDKYATKLQELVEEKNKLTEEIANTPEKKTQKQIQRELVDKTGIIEEGLDNANRMSKFMLNNTDPIRIQEMVFGQDVGNKINEEFFQKVKDNTSDKTRWLNEQRTKIKELGIKAHSKESAAVQKYAEKKYVSEKNGEVFSYGDNELAAEFPNVKTQEKIKKAAKEIRGLYDEYLDTVNPVLEKLGYNPIAKREDYVRHFQELNDKFSQWGIPLNLNDMKANDLPTDINGITADFKPGKNFFANALQRTGLRTTYDAITGIDGYLEGVSNLIYHTEDVQRLRGFEKYIRDTYGKEHGYENLEELTDEQKAKRMQAIENNNLSNYASWLHEYTNQLAGKKAMADRAVEDIFGRKIFSILDTANKQVGANMIGFNISSAATNAIAGVQALAKTNKKAAVKGLYDSVINIFHNDGFVEKNNFLTSRFGSDRLSKTPWQKISDAGYMFMSGTDNFISNFVVRSKFNELKAKGLSDTEAHVEAGKFASKLMADRSQGGQATLYNSKALGVLTKFQYEVNNQLYSMFYDTFQDSKAKSNGNVVKMTASMASTLGQLAIFTHIFGTAFEKMAGYNPTFDIIGIIAKALGFDDDDDSEDKLEDNLGQAFNDLLKALPYSSIFTGGRVPIGEALPFKELITGKDSYGNDTSRLKTLKETVPYWLMPTGYGQLKKTTGGLGLFDEDLPVPGSYTDSGNLRFTVEDTTENRIKSAVFGKWSNEEARKYIDSEFKTIDKDNVEELADLEMKSSEYRKYRKGLSEAKKSAKDNDELSQAQAVFDYIESLNVSNKQKTIMLENQFNANLDDESEAKLKSLNMSTDEKISFYTSKAKVSEYTNDYDNEVKKLKDAYGESSNTYKEKTKELAKEKQKKVIEEVRNANLNDEQKTYLYTKYYSSEDALDKITSNGTSVDDYLKYKLDTIDYVSDEDKDGDKINGSLAKKKIEYLRSSNLSTNDIQNIYENDVLGDFDNEKKYKAYKAVKAMGVDINSWLDYSTQEFEADYNRKGKAIPNSKKNKVVSYVNSLNLSIPQKAAIIRSEYSSFDDYNDTIVKYVDGLNMDYSKKVNILESLGAKVYEDGSVRWK